MKLYFVALIIQLGPNKILSLYNLQLLHGPIFTVLLAELYCKLIYLNVIMIYTCNYVYSLSLIVCCYFLIVSNQCHKVSNV